ncbi:hypothetical protein P4055_10865 [Pseudomonas aeruginosa]|nr:hypothetical protein [Pseudomonas aeruginosa]
MQPPKLGREIATTGDGRGITRPFLSGLQQPERLRAAAPGRRDLRIYEEVLRGAQVKATWGQRRRPSSARSGRSMPAATGRSARP